MLNEHQGARLSINGWLHGPVNHRPSPLLERLPIAKPASEYQAQDVRGLSMSRMSRRMYCSSVRTCQPNDQSDVSESGNSVRCANGISREFRE